ncbi:MAG: YceI family protein [Flammeovirgaceae bacterium]
MSKKLLLTAAGLVVAGLAGWFFYNKYRVVVPPVDGTQSEIGWSAKSVTDTHVGKIKLAKAELQFQNNRLVGGFFEADMNSVTVTDITDAQHNQDFINHITTGDFFEVNRFPTASFRITEANPKAGDEYNIRGVMTIKDREQPVEFTATVTPTPTGKRTSATLSVDRTMFGIEYGAQGKRGSEKDWFIHNEFVLNVNVVTE